MAKKTGVYSKIKNFIKENSLINSKEKVILGVSGGPDSVFLFHAFLRLKEDKDFLSRFVVVHFNHSLRPEADKEEEFVKKMCADFDLPFVSEKKDVRQFFSGDSLEQTARALRYDFFLSQARRLKIKKVVLAHHKDDLAETVLLRLIRGTGLLGLRGIAPLIKYKKIILVRPLLGIEKKDILTFLDNKGISYMTDKSNFDEEFLRNKIRLKLMPLLQEMNPKIKDNFYSLSKSISLDYQFIYSETVKVFNKAVKFQGDKQLKISLDLLGKLNPCLLNNLIRISIERLKGHLRRIELRHIEEVIDLMRFRPQGSVVDLPGIKVVKEKASLVFILP